MPLILMERRRLASSFCEILPHPSTKATASSQTFMGEQVVCHSKDLLLSFFLSPCSTVLGVLHCGHCSLLFCPVATCNPYASLQQEYCMFIQMRRDPGHLILVIFRVSRKVSLLSYVTVNVTLIANC